MGGRTHFGLIVGGVVVVVLALAGYWVSQNMYIRVTHQTVLTSAFSGPLVEAMEAGVSHAELEQLVESSPELLLMRSNAFQLPMDYAIFKQSWDELEILLLHVQGIYPTKVLVFTAEQAIKRKNFNALPLLERVIPSDDLDLYRESLQALFQQKGLEAIPVP